MLKTRANRGTDREQYTRSNAATIAYITLYYTILPHTCSSETGRNLNTGLDDHRPTTTKSDVNAHIAEHHLQTNHCIKWASAVRITTNE